MTAMLTTTIKIKGMTCMGCVNSVKNALKNATGVIQVDASLNPPQAAVQYDQASTNIDLLKEAIIDAGFEVVDA
ncbi:copper chaperone [Nitrosomonas sp. Nm84]|uniref:heavy-metal-associated domain-containing protein n=1 Tax=Nitrosomonas sp. Nm84 TaxID=200124 RepID=UPI000D959088|nr:heavy-metal-associated domain-containing protein [Nitrosomonas sp. Nm84]PXW91196.1 copper chaperone [Nitrosomonas sp. Nm84]